MSTGMYVSCVICNIDPRIKWSELSSLHVCCVSVFAELPGCYFVLPHCSSLTMGGSQEELIA